MKVTICRRLEATPYLGCFREQSMPEKPVRCEHEERRCYEIV